MSVRTDCLHNTPRLAEPEFRRLATYIRGALGIKMPDHKRGLLELRLGKRIRHLGLDSFEAYCAHVFDAEGSEAERLELIDAVTTNKTDFFREPEHFERLIHHVLPELLESGLEGAPNRPLRVWSAGCSSGEEPYTLGIVLSEFADRNPGLHVDFQITATDLSIAMLRTAVRGVYLRDRIRCVPDRLVRRHFLNGFGGSEGLVRVAPHIRGSVDFSRANLMDPYRFETQFDIIFCRNVLIYFDRETQVSILSRMHDQLAAGGYLFVGHSETLHGMGLPLDHIAPTVYRRVDSP